MSTWLLTWNPQKFEWDNVGRASRTTRAGKPIKGSWSCGNTRRIERGDRVFLLKQGLEPKGIVAAGVSRGTPLLGELWDGRDGLYVDVLWEDILDPSLEQPLPVTRVSRGPLSEIHWGTQKSGIAIEPNAASELEAAWAQHVRKLGREVRLSDENDHQSEDLTEDADFGPLDEEGRRRLRRHFHVERSARNRAIVLQARAASLWCDACGFNAGEIFGPELARLLEVHHMVPVASGKRVPQLGEFALLCPTCHRVAHYRRGPEPLSVAQIQKLRAPRRRRGLE